MLYNFWAAYQVILLSLLQMFLQRDILILYWPKLLIDFFALIKMLIRQLYTLLSRVQPQHRPKAKST